MIHIHGGQLNKKNLTQKKVKAEVLHLEINTVLYTA